MGHQRQIYNCIYKLGKLVNVTFDENTENKRIQIR